MIAERWWEEKNIVVFSQFISLLQYSSIKGLSHEMDLAFDDMHGQFKA